MASNRNPSTERRTEEWRRAHLARTSERFRSRSGSAPQRRASGEGAVRLQDGDVRVVEALPVHVVRVAVDGVAALHLDDGGGRVGGRAQGVRVVPDAAAELDVVLVPVSPQNRLDLKTGQTF